MSDDDVAERAGSDVAVERLVRAVQLGSGLRGGFEPVRRGLARLVLAMVAAAKVGLGGGLEAVRQGWVPLALAILDLDETSVAGESVTVRV